MVKSHTLKQNLGCSLSLLWRSSHFLLPLYVLSQLVVATLPMVSLYLFNLLLNEIALPEPDMARVGVLILLDVLALTGVSALSSLDQLLRGTIQEKGAHQFDVELSEDLIVLPLSFLDSSQGKDQIEGAQYSRDTVCQFPFDAVNVLSSGYQFVITLGFLLRFSPVLTFGLLALCIPGILLDNYAQKRMYSWSMDTFSDRRRVSYYRWMLTDAWPAKDVRMYNLTGPIQARYSEEKKTFLKQKSRYLKTELRLGQLATVLQQAGAMLFIAYIVYEAVRGGVSIGEVALYVGYSDMLISSFYLIFLMLVNYHSITKEQFTLYDAVRQQTFQVQSAAQLCRELTEFSSLEFRQVTFTYPFTDTPVLRDVSFSLASGERLSIIGINGAGKTTIVKLMLGLYQPDSGQIYVNGYPMADYSLQDVRRLFSALFQSFVQYPLTLRENVALSDLDRMDQDPAIRESIASCGLGWASGIDLDTYMSRQFDDSGVELSTGQWQRLALARAYFKDSPILILDEPSASLDPIAEDKIFQEIEALPCDKTVIMISHRISSARLASKIIVLDGGTVKEAGTHDSLMEQRGLYAKLYNLQLNKYKAS